MGKIKYAVFMSHSGRSEFKMDKNKIQSNANTSKSLSIKIVARADVPVPFSRVMESYVLPSKEKLQNAIYSIFPLKNKE